jgi:hypothetical protein
LAKSRYKIHHKFWKNFGIILYRAYPLLLLRNKKKGEHMVNKITIISVCLLLGVSIAAAAPTLTQQIIQATTLDPTGTFDGNIG